MIATQPTNQITFKGGTASFTFSATSAAPLNYQWLLNGTPVSGATNSSLTLTNVQFKEAGLYSMLAGNSVGSVTSAPASLIVRQIVPWGWFSLGQTNIPTDLTNVIGIAAGGNHVLALGAEGNVMGWGANNYGQTNVPAGLTNAMAIAAGYVHSLALKSNGTVAAWGNNVYRQSTPPQGLTNVVAVTCGDCT
jgi:hypothetical protein